MIFMVYETMELLNAGEPRGKTDRGGAMSLIEKDETEAVGDDGYRKIRTDIVFGRLRPGQKLKL